MHQRMRSVFRQFLERGLISDKSRARFDAAMASALRLRNSVMAEVLLIAFVYFVGILYIWPRYSALEVATWYAVPAGGDRQLSLAGRWFVVYQPPALPVHPLPLVFPAVRLDPFPLAGDAM